MDIDPRTLGVPADPAYKQFEVEFFVGKNPKNPLTTITINAITSEEAVRQASQIFRIGVKEIKPKFQNA